jgi:hypothetical protein
VILVAGQSQVIHVVFTGTPAGLDATIDIPLQGANGVPLRAVRVDAGAVHFELPAGPGLAVFDGRIEGDRRLPQRVRRTSHLR